MVATATHHSAFAQAGDSGDPDFQNARRFPGVRPHIRADRRWARDVDGARGTLHLQRSAPESTIRLRLGAVGGDFCDHLWTGPLLRAGTWGEARGRGVKSQQAGATTRGWGRWVFGGALVLLMLFTLFPFYWAIVASFTSDAALFRDPSLI